MILVINPGSTSTKLAVFKNTEKVIQENLDHDVRELQQFEKITDQYEYRKEAILKWLDQHGIKESELIAVVGRGGLLRPMPSGTYLVTDPMLEDLKIGIQGEHASNLGGMIANAIAQKEGIKAYIVDPVAVDEFEPLARISGMPEIQRRSLVHALNVRAIAHSYAEDVGKKINDLNLIVAHLGGGISIAPLRKGKIVDVNNANEMGPFSPERTGGLPIGDLAKMCYSGEYTFAELKKKMRGTGGLAAYLGTNDAREVQKMIDSGDQNAKLIFEAMGYQIAKEIGAMATVLGGQVDAILMTGGIAYSEFLMNYIKEHVGFIAPFVVKPGEDEMKALNLGTLRVLNGEDTVKIYEDEVNING
jgi:butyrate kinase